MTIEELALLEEIKAKEDLLTGMIFRDLYINVVETALNGDVYMRM